MTLTIDLTPAEEARLRDRAAREGVEPETLASDILRENLFPIQSLEEVEEEVAALPRVVDEGGVYHPERWQAWEDLLRRRFGNLPVLPAEALTREALYMDHD